MGRQMLWMWCCLVGLATVAIAQPSKLEKPATAGLAAAAKDLAADLKGARELLKQVTDRATRDRLELLITRSELKALELEKALAGVNIPSVPTIAAPQPMSAESFAKLMKGLKAEAFDDGKASFIASFAAQGRLTCAQARELLKTFSFDDGRTKSAVVLYPRLTDPENFFTVLDVFSFDSSRSEVREKLKLKK